MSHSSKSNVIISTSSSGHPKWRQSPIDLKCVNVWQRKFPPLLLGGHWKNEGTAIVKNTGETVQVEIQNRAAPVISGGPLSDYYEFLHLQFRWGENNSSGAEHSIDNTWYSMEAQAIHWNSRYETLEKCYENSDGMAIISYLFLVSGCDGIADNVEFKNISDALSSINTIGKSVNISPDSLNWMTNCFFHPGYYTYEGSLTNFPYSQCVTWIIIPRPIKISLNQIDKLMANQEWRNGNLIVFYILGSKKKKSQVVFYSKGFQKSGQSPVNIDDNAVLNTKFPQLILTGHWLNDGCARMVNNGETVKITLSGDRIPSTIKGGPLLDDVYEFENVHFHWGENNCQGSEHTLNDTWFSMEAHAVHWNRKYITFAECLKQKDGICVLAFLFLATHKNCLWSNFHLEGITDNLKYIQEPEIVTEIPANCLYWMKSCLTVENYYTYRGSLTTHPYNECVTWIISPKSIMISPTQIDEFRKLRNDKNEKIKDNARKVQNLRGRRVFLSC